MIPLLRLAMVGFALLLNAMPLAAQDARDPTIAPGESGATAQTPTGGAEGMTVLVRDERPYLVVGTRLYAPGDKVGNLRVERITETEIWFHDGSAVSKVPRFTGIGRTVVVAKSSCAAQTPAPVAAPTSPPDGATTPKIRPKVRKKAQAHQATTAPNPPPAVAPCEDTQP